MLPTLVLSTVLALASPSAGVPDLSVQEPVANVEVATLEAAGELELDGFASDVEGFPERRLDEAGAGRAAWTEPLGLARTFLGVWFAVSALFGLVWGLLGWATRARRIPART